VSIDKTPHSALRAPHSVLPYTALAAGYDAVMQHVDYQAWAAYAHHRLQENHPNPQDLLELGCGTGSLAVALQPMGGYRYTATDRSAEMIRHARHKAAQARVSVTFGVADFTDFQVEEPVNAVVLLYDGLNYLLEKEQVAALLRCAYAALRPGGIFLFDQSTPANSINNEVYFEGQGRTRSFSYVRQSRYDAETRLHTTTFTLTAGRERLQEEHVQRAYHLAEIHALVQASGFTEIAAYDDFSTIPATEDAERIHWIVRRD
jgi:ubiquinone/menaquinone biosynthesis C-methylase UbiE